MAAVDCQGSEVVVHLVVVGDKFERAVGVLCIIRRWHFGNLGDIEYRYLDQPTIVQD